jgi:hypothetical protein
MSKVFDDAFGMPHIERAMTNTNNAAEQIAALLASDTAEEIESLLVMMLGYDPDVTVLRDCEKPYSVWCCDGDMIGAGATRAEAMADAIVYLDSLTVSEPDDGSAFEHGYFLNHGDR